MTQSDRIVARLRRRLESAELDLLREIVAEQAARIEKLEADLERANQDADSAYARAELWEDNYFAASEAMRQAGAVPGITQDGRLVMVSGTVAH